MNPQDISYRAEQRGENDPNFGASLKSIAPDQLKIKLPERQLTLDQQLIYNNVMRFVETNLFHALESGFYIEDGKERLRIELRLSADTPDDIDFRCQVETVLP